MIVGLELNITDKKFYLRMFQIVRFYYNMRCRAKDNLILEEIYNQGDLDYYIS